MTRHFFVNVDHAKARLAVVHELAGWLLHKIKAGEQKLARGVLHHLEPQVHIGSVLGSDKPSAADLLAPRVNDPTRAIHQHNALVLAEVVEHC